MVALTAKKPAPIHFCICALRKRFVRCLQKQHNNNELYDGVGGRLFSGSGFAFVS